MPTKPAKTEPDMTFETAVERLEQIVEAMESDKLPLADLLVRYEEGTKLVKFCQDQLTVAEKRIEVITRNAKGELQVQPFEPERTAAAAAAPVPPAALTPAAAAAPGASKTKPDDEVSLF